MNVNLPPFNNLKARQAVNYAIDRNALVGIIGGPKLATPSCQVLPPGFPGHVELLPVHEEPGGDLVCLREVNANGRSESRRKRVAATMSVGLIASTMPR